MRATTAIRSSRRRRGCRWSCCSGGAPALSSRRSTTSRPGARSTLPPQHGSAGQLFPTSPVSADAILLTSMRIEPLADDLDLGTGLIRAVVDDLVRRNVRALEAFGIRTVDDAEPNTGVPSATAALDCSPAECMISAEFLEDMGGFEVVALILAFPGCVSNWIGTTDGRKRSRPHSTGSSRPHRSRSRNSTAAGPRSELADRLAVSRETSGVTQKRSTAGPEPAVLRCAG